MKSTDFTAEFYDKVEKFCLKHHFTEREVEEITSIVRNNKGLNAKMEQVIRFVTEICFFDESARYSFINAIKKLRKEYLDSLVMPETAKKRNMKRIVKTKGWRK